MNTALILSSQSVNSSDGDDDDDVMMMMMSALSQSYDRHVALNVSRCEIM